MNAEIDRILRREMLRCEIRGFLIHLPVILFLIGFWSLVGWGLVHLIP